MPVIDEDVSSITNEWNIIINQQLIHFGFSSFFFFDRHPSQYNNCMLQKVHPNLLVATERSIQTVNTANKSDRIQNSNLNSLEKRSGGK